MPAIALELFLPGGAAPGRQFALNTFSVEVFHAESGGMRGIADMSLPGRVNTTFDQTAAFYMNEVRALAGITTLPEFDDLLEKLANYQNYLRTKKKAGDCLHAIIAASGGGRILDTNTAAEFLVEALSLAHMAACCELMNGSRIPRHELQPQTLDILAKNFLRQLQGAPESVVRNTHNKLHTMDAVRTIHLLRALGLVTRSPGGFAQLALGSGSGFKDMYSLHKMPGVVLDRNNNAPVYTFAIEQERVGHVVISDPDPQHRECYERLNQQGDLPVLALNLGADAVMSELHESGMDKRNLVTLIRMDHRMIPDESAFLEKLASCIDEQCDLIMTIGSGASFEDFAGRLLLMRKMYDRLDWSGLKPVLLKLHGPGSLEQQHGSLKFGNPMISTYQILYCKLQRKRLKSVS